MNRDIRELLQVCEDQGFHVRTTKGGHYLVTSPDREAVTTVPSTPSDWRSLRNCVAALRRYGFVWKGR